MSEPTFNSELNNDDVKNIGEVAESKNSSSRVGKTSLKLVKPEIQKNVETDDNITGNNSSASEGKSVPVGGTPLKRPSTPLRRDGKRPGTPLHRDGKPSKSRRDTSSPLPTNKSSKHRLEYVDDDVIIEQNYVRPQNTTTAPSVAPIGKGRGRRAWDLKERRQIQVGKYRIPLLTSIISILLIVGVILAVFFFANKVRSESQAENNAPKAPSKENVELLYINSPIYSLL